MHVRYLNVDCILRSDRGLTDLILLLKDNIFILWNESSEDSDSVGFETKLINTSGPEEDISEFIRLFNLLPPSLLQMLNNCNEKTFNIGFESGILGDPLNVIMNPEVVKKIAKLGFSISIRIYPKNIS